jgi:HSP20 family protein
MSLFGRIETGSEIMVDATKNPEQYRVVDREFQNIRELLELLMTEMAAGDKKLKAGPPLAWAPPTDVYDTDTELVVTMDIAGMDIKDIRVSTDDNMITICGVRQEVSPRCKKQFHKMEIPVGPFQRSIQIPVPCELKRFSTTYSKGLLEVRLKRKLDRPGKRRIDVE